MEARCMIVAQDSRHSFGRVYPSLVCHPQWKLNKQKKKQKNFENAVVNPSFDFVTESTRKLLGNSH